MNLYKLSELNNRAIKICQDNSLDETKVMIVLLAGLHLSRYELDEHIDNAGEIYDLFFNEEGYKFYPFEDNPTSQLMNLLINDHGFTRHGHPRNPQSHVVMSIRDRNAITLTLLGLIAQYNVSIKEIAECIASHYLTISSSQPPILSTVITNYLEGYLIKKRRR